LSARRMCPDARPDVKNNSVEPIEDDRNEFCELNDAEVAFITGGNDSVVEITPCRMCGKIDNVVVVEDRGDSLFVKCINCDLYWTCT